MNKKENTIPKGYKLSPLGLIPEDWEEARISEFGSVYTGNTPPTNDLSNYGTDYLFVGPVDLGENKYIAKTEKGLSEKGFSISRKFPKGSVLFTCIGSTIGKSGIATENLTSNQQINAIVVNENNCNEFLYYQLFTNSNKIKLLAGEQAVPIINKSQFESVKVLRAPLSEQTAIANLLSTWDRAITHTTQLIAQKELRKKWLMQQLLTGKKRLPAFAKATAGKKGFKERFREYRINQLFEMIDRYVEWNDSELYKLVSIRRRFGGLFYRGDLLGEQIGVKTLKSVYNDDFLISKRQVAHGAWAVVTKEFHDAKVSDEYDSLIVKDNEKLNSSFWSWYCQQPIMRHYAFLDSVGVHIEKLIFDYNQFKKRKVLIPGTIEEQTAIANVLQSADAELNLLRQKLDKLKEQKKGLMQVLLTGKKRLNV